MLDERWLTNHGPYVAELESTLADMIGVRNVVATCNGTLALELAIRALGLHGEVIVPSFTFVATAHALRWSGIRPVFCDIDPLTHTIDASHAERLITPRTTGILGVHVWGAASDVAGLEAVAGERNLALVFDAAHALACTHQGRSIGGFGNAEVFSFHATKVANAFEGGAIATDDDGLAERLRLLGNFGFSDEDRVVTLGTNAKMTEAAACMGLTSLESLDAFVEHNRRNFLLYDEMLRDVPGVRLMRPREGERSNFHYVVLEVTDVAGLRRDELHKVLRAERVLARRYFYPGCHRLEPYCSDPAGSAPLPVTERVCEQVLCLPTGTSVDPDDVAIVCGLIQEALDHAGEVRARLVDLDGNPRA